MKINVCASHLVLTGKDVLAVNGISIRHCTGNTGMSYIILLYQNIIYYYHILRLSYCCHISVQRDQPYTLFSQPNIPSWTCTIFWSWRPCCLPQGSIPLSPAVFWVRGELSRPLEGRKREKCLKHSAGKQSERQQKNSGKGPQCWGQARAKGMCE